MNFNTEFTVAMTYKHIGQVYLTKNPQKDLEFQNQKYFCIRNIAAWK